MILVTGGTGLVGSHLLLHLAQSGHRLRATFRTKERLKYTKKIFSYHTANYEALFKIIEWVKCDLNDIPALEIAFSNVTHVYHCAALISFDPNDAKELYKINVVGTLNIVNLCIANSIKKLCNVSSIATIGNTTDGSPANETTEFNEALANVYALSKHQAEMEVWRGSQEGIEIVIINPGVILGPGFWNNGSGQIFQKISKGLRFYLPGGTGFVTVKDVVNAMVNLMNSNIVNENYILVSKNLSYKEAFSTIAMALNKKTPKVRLKKWMLATLWRLDFLKSMIIGSKRVLSKKMVQSFGLATTYGNKKIKEDLKFEFEDLDASIQFYSSIFLEENH